MGSFSQAVPPTVPKEEFNELRNQVNEMKHMLIKIMAALEKESKEDKPV